jgi:hypothetical protein
VAERQRWQMGDFFGEKLSNGWMMGGDGEQHVWYSVLFGTVDNTRSFTLRWRLVVES